MREVEELPNITRNDLLHCAACDTRLRMRDTDKNSEICCPNCHKWQCLDHSETPQENKGEIPRTKISLDYNGCYEV